MGRHSNNNLFVPPRTPFVTVDKSEGFIKIRRHSRYDTMTTIRPTWGYRVDTIAYVFPNNLPGMDGKHRASDQAPRVVPINQEYLSLLNRGMAENGYQLRITGWRP